MGRCRSRAKRERRQGAAMRAADQEFLQRTSSAEQQSPFSWELERVVDRGLAVLLDSAPYRPTPWASVLDRIHCAYQLYSNGDGKCARDLLEENYNLLMNDSACDELILKYKPALKHVLDSSWLRVRLEIEVPLPDGTHEEDVVRFSALDSRQQSAVWAMRAVMGDDEWLPNKRSLRYGFISKALQLNPSEGMWKYYLANAMLQSRDGFGSYKREVTAFEEAYATVKTPETVLGLATALMFDGTVESNRQCAQLAKDALELYPDTPYVYLDCAHIWINLSGKHRNARLAEHCHRKALELAPDWKLAHLKFGSFCQSHGRPGESMTHLRIAAEVHEGAVDEILNPTSSRRSGSGLDIDSNLFDYLCMDRLLRCTTLFD